MKKIRAKLNSRKGVTVIFALTFFLIAAVISMIMVNGALSAVQNAALLRKQEKMMLCGESAARLVEKELADTGTALKPSIYVRDIVIDDVECDLTEGDKGYAAERSALSSEVERLRAKYKINKTTSIKDGQIQERQLWNGDSHEVYTKSVSSLKHLILLAAVRAVSNSGAKEDLTISDVTDGSDAVADMLPVSISFTADGNQMNALLTLKEDDKVLFKLTMVFNCEITQSPDTVTVHYSYEDTDENGITTTVSDSHDIEISDTIYRWSLTQVIQGEDSTT